MKRVYANEDVCMACHLCEVYCLAAHSRSKDLIKAFKTEMPKNRSRVQVVEQGVVSFANLCRHCQQPVCAYSCLAGALHKDSKSGVVTVDLDKCVGCWTCIMVCPHGAIVPDFARDKIAKCDLCVNRQTPACVANCPNQALSYREEKPGLLN